MVLTQSVDGSTGAKAPSFKLHEPLTGNEFDLDSCIGAPATLIIFMCNHCPFVIHLKEAITQLAKEYIAQGVKVVGISANSVDTHPQDGPEAMAAEARQLGYPFPYLHDATQQVAVAYQAACTPEFIVLDGQLRVQYHGRFDDSSPGKSRPVTGKDLRAALDAIMATKVYTGPQQRSMGCNIKWHPGKEPAYFGRQ